MSILTVRVDAHVDQLKTCTDVISKLYGIIAWILGINRLYILFNLKNKCKLISIVYSLLFNILIFYLTLSLSYDSVYLRFINFVKYLLCAIIAIIYNGTLLKFYNGLIQFDKDIKIKSQTTSESIINCIQAFSTLVLIGVINIWRRYVETLNDVTPEIMAAHLCHVWELYYYGHLFNLIKLRLKYIRILLLTSFPSKDLKHWSENEYVNFKDKNISNLLATNKKVDVRKLLNLYTKIINIYDYLNKAIQCQILLILSATLLAMLTWSYYAALSILNNEYTWIEGLFDVAMFSAMFGPMFTICGFGQRIHDEVILLRTALYSRIYKNAFDKTSRSIASSLLALTEVRSLSFSVFRMFDLNISFPFKFFGLLASYLVILLQFNKVTDFDVPSE